MFSKHRNLLDALGGDQGRSRALKTAGYALAGTALLGFSTVQSGLASPQASADTEDGAATPTTDGASVTSTLAYSSAGTPGEKDETVYVFSKPDGTVKNTKVSTELKNPKKASTLRDQTDLTNIENTENDGEFSTSGEGTVWQAKGDNVYYMGDTDKQAPVKMKVSYQLDGHDIAPDELLGKSGRVKIRFDFTNDSYEEKTVDGKLTRIYTPFMALTGMLFDNDQFSNVKAKNARVLDDGDRTIVAGYALPGLQESLDIDEDTYKVPTYIEVTADTTDFELGQTLTMVSSDLFSDVDTDKLDSGKLDSSIDQLQSGMDKLINGSDELVSGLNNLNSGAHTLSAGARTLAAGTSTLSKSTPALAKGVRKLDSGASKLASGVKTAGTQGKALPAGSKQMLGGLQQMRNGTKDTTGLADALASIGSTSDTGSTTLMGGVNQVSAGLSQLGGGIGSKTDTTAETLYGGTNLLAGGLSQLASQSSAGLSTASAGASTLEKGLEQLKNGEDGKGGLVAAQQGAKQIADGLKGVDLSSLTQLASSASGSASKLKQAAQGIRTVANNLSGEQKTALEGIATQLDTAAENATLSDADQKKLASLSSGVSTLQKGASDLENGLASANKALGSAGDGSTTLIGGAHALATGLDSSQVALSSGVGELQAGVTRLQGGLDTMGSGVSALSTGTGSLKSGLDMLANGTDGKKVNGKTSTGLKGAVSALGTTKTKGTLINGASQIATGSDKLVTALNGQILPGAQQLSKGTAQLDGKVPALTGGVKKLNTGAHSLASGAARLADGSTSAYAGSQKLSRGLKTYNRKGIRKIVDAYNDNLRGLSKRLDAVVAAGDDYTNFAGIEKHTKGKVKFVFETDAIEHDDE